MTTIEILRRARMLSAGIGFLGFAALATAQTNIYYIHSDHLDTPRVVTDAANRIVWRNGPGTEPFGASVVEEDPDGDGTPFVLNLRFPGQYFDRETGLAYNYFRDYDPQTGRYVQSDPIGLEGGINLYLYVGGNPLSLVDPQGLQSLYTNSREGRTTFDPAPYSGTPITIPTSTSVARGARPGANQGFNTPDVNWIPSGTGSRAFGPDGSYIDTGDIRGLDIHGGGSRLADPFAPAQGWAPTLGCTRGQNDDVRRLGEAIDQFKRANPGVPVPYYRY